MKILDASYIKSANTPKSWLPESLPEVAFSGRSNVGKSSLINTLLNRRGLARTSGKPGRTRLINFFRVLTDQGELHFADLPGYGYAMVSKKERDQWRPMVERYFVSRKTLRLVLILVDARRGILAQDIQLASFLKDHQIPFAVAVTKIDKVPKPSWGSLTSSITTATGVGKGRVVLTSAVSRQGMDPLWTCITNATTPTPDPPPPQTAQQPNSKYTQ